MAEENVLRELEDREDAAMQIQLTAAVQRSAVTIQEYISMRQLSETSDSIILAELLDDLNNNGRIFGEFRNAVTATAQGNLRRVSDIGQFTENGVEIEYVWITVQDDKVCPDCAPRHRRKEKWVKWEVLGLPATGWSVCRSHCRCTLAPTGTPAQVPETPIKRARRKRK